jgi:acyl-CoA thioesterase
MAHSEPIADDDADSAVLDFERLTRVHPDENAGRWRLTFGPQTTIWSVNGGYLAGAILRAAGLAAERALPLTITCDFIRPVKAGDVVIEHEVLVRTHLAELIGLRLLQQERPCVLAQVWTMNAHEGPRHHDARMPAAPHPTELRTMQEMLRPDEPPLRPFWDVFDQRPINRVDPHARSAQRAQVLRWLRYAGTSDLEDPYFRAALTLPIIDTMGVPALRQAPGPVKVPNSVAPTVQLCVHFREPGGPPGWMLAEASAEYSGNGLISTAGRVWSENGRLLADGLTQMVCLPTVARPPDSSRT